MTWQIKQLEAFHAVMATGGMTRAAEGLHITQPAVSKLIAMLEEECGFALFARQGNRLTPTAEAEILYTEVQRMMHSTHEIHRKAEELRERRFGTLSIAAFPALATRVLPGIITAFCKTRPAVNVLLTGRSSAFMVNWLAAQRVDLGISVLRLNEPGFQCERVLRMEAVCAVPAEHPLTRYKVLTPELIATAPLISLGTEDKSRTMVEQFFESSNVRFRTSIETQLSESACQFVADGAGVSIVEPLSTLRFGEHEIAVRPISPRFLFDIWLIVPTGRPSSLITSEFGKYFARKIKGILKGRGFYFTT